MTKNDQLARDGDDAAIEHWKVPFWHLAVIVQIPVVLGVVGVLPFELSTLGSIILMAVLLTGVQEQCKGKL